MDTVIASETAAGVTAESIVGPWTRLPARTLVYSHVIPPHASGHATVLSRLFRNVHPDDYRLVTFDDLPDSFQNNQSGGRPLPARTRSYESQWSFAVPPGYPRTLTRARYARRLSAEIAITAVRMARLCRKEECRVIVATSGTMPRLPAAVVAARLAQVPLVLLIWDFWRFQEEEPFLRRLVSALEPAVYGAASAIAVPNELLADSIARVDGVRPVVIRNPVDDAAIDGAPDGSLFEHRPGPYRIVFSGQIYEAMSDAVINLMSALTDPGLDDVELHYYGPQTISDLNAIGVRGRIVCHPFVPPPDIYRVQREADALFLPLAFEGSLKDLIYSSSTTKLADYLASGRPIIVHTPPGAFPAWYARRHECGLVVDTPDPKALAKAIQLLRTDAALGHRLGGRGRERARADFSIERAQKDLVHLLATVLRRT